MPQITVNGKIVSYDKQGDGAPLVFVHGYPLDRTIWAAQVSELSKDACVIAPDLRGFGQSELGSGPIDISTYADDVHDFLKAIGVTEKIILCGLSMGGYVVMAYLRKYASDVRAVIFANTKATADSAEGKAGRDKAIELVKEKGSAAIAEAMLPKLLSAKTIETNPKLVERVKQIMNGASVPGIVAALGAMRDRPDSIETLKNFSGPVLIIAGQDDQLMPMAEQELMKTAARNGNLVVIPSAGHLSPMEQLDLFSNQLAQFLRKS